MQQLILLVFLFLGTQSFGQTTSLDIKKFTPKEPYTNISNNKLYSDENTSVFLIFVKQAVRKHVHQYHTEVITVLEGKGKMYLGGELFNISKGDHIVVPPNTAHAVITTSKKPLKVLSIQSPEFDGEDRIFLEEEPTEESSNKEGTGKDSDIPEFEGEND